MLSQVDQHTETASVSRLGQEDVVIAGQLARRANAMMLKKLVLGGRDTAESASVMTALLATEQHHRLFQRVQDLRLGGRLSNEMLQVSGRNT
jgi:hypothetical protein